MTGNILHKKQMKREIFLSAFFAFREEKEIMYGKLFVGFSEILSTKKQKKVKEFEQLRDQRKAVMNPFYNTM